MRLAFGLAMALAFGLTDGQPAEAAQNSAELAVPLSILFDDSCDGMDLRLFRSGRVLGRHSGCNAGELATGSQFSANGETGLTVLFRDQLSGLMLQVDIYQTGFRAGRFYVFERFSHELLRFSTFSLAPPED